MWAFLLTRQSLAQSSSLGVWGADWSLIPFFAYLRELYVIQNVLARTRISCPSVRNRCQGLSARQPKGGFDRAAVKCKAVYCKYIKVRSRLPVHQRALHFTVQQCLQNSNRSTGCQIWQCQSRSADPTGASFHPKSLSCSK